MSRKSLSHDHAALERSLRRLKERFKTISTDGRTVIEAADEISTLREKMLAHHHDEENNLFPFAARTHGGWDDELEALVTGHRTLEAQLDEMESLLTNETNIPAATEALSRFSEVFEAHTLAEADFFATRWDELFPDEAMAG